MALVPSEILSTLDLCPKAESKYYFSLQILTGASALLSQQRFAHNWCSIKISLPGWGEVGRGRKQNEWPSSNKGGSSFPEGLLCVGQALGPGQTRALPSGVQTRQGSTRTISDSAWGSERRDGASGQGGQVTWPEWADMARLRR